MCVPATQVRADGAGREGEGRCSQAETGAYIQSVYLPIGATLPRQLALLLLALASYAVPLLVLVGMAWRVLCAVGTQLRPMVVDSKPHVS